MYMSFDLHTHDTLLSVEKILKDFGCILTVRLFLFKFVWSMYLSICKEIHFSDSADKHQKLEFPENTHT